MIRTLGFTTDNELIFDFPLSEIHMGKLQWYWVDFDRPSEEETALLHSFFKFHPLAIEDCLDGLQRPKLNYYDDYTFFVLHAISESDLEAKELNMFFGENYVVTFHFDQLKELEVARERITRNPTKWEEGHVFTAYQVIDKVVDNFFPILYKIEDHLNDIEEKLSPTTIHLSMDFVFEVRSDLLRLRRTVIPMRELLYRMLNSEQLAFSKHERTYFSDIHDHLLRLVEILEMNRELTADIRESQLSINSNQMNRIMMMLTIVSSVFIPLTFIAGVYGMNFDFMPELAWRYSYPLVLIIMLAIGIMMLLWFKHKGWLGLFKS